MKKFTLSVLCLLTATLAQARSLQNINSITLNNVKFDGVLQDKAVAVVTINASTQKLKVSLYNDHCGTYAEQNPDMPIVHCLAMPSLINSYEVTYTVSNDGCGSKVYSGSYDQRPVDGEHVEVKLIDNSTRVCEDVLMGRTTLQVKSESLLGQNKEVFAYGNATLKINNDEAIYNALNVKEVVLNPGITGASRTQKSVGGLVCEKTLIIYPGAVPSYSCTLNR